MSTALKEEIMSEEELRPNFGNSDSDERSCKNCKTAGFTADGAAFCMAGMAPGTAAEQGHRVNQNFVCDNFSSN